MQEALIDLTGFLSRPQADSLLLRRAGSTLDRALFPLLVRAALRESITVGELADTVGRHHSTVSRQLTVLESQGLVTRAADRDDRRCSVVSVTQAGRAEVARIAAAREELMASLFVEWTEQEKADLTRLVTKLVSSLETAAAKARASGDLR